MGLTPDARLCAECHTRDAEEGSDLCATCLTWELPHPDTYRGPTRPSDWVPDDDHDMNGRPL